MKSAERSWAMAAMIFASFQPSFSSAAEPPNVNTRLDALEARSARMEADLLAIRALLESEANSPSHLKLKGVNAEQLASVANGVDGLRHELVDVQNALAQQNEAAAAEGVARKRSVSISTYGQIVGFKRSDENSVLDAESFELVLSGQPHERISFFSELEFERAAGVGGPRGGEVAVEQAYVDYSLNDVLAVRAGVILVPFSNNDADHYAPLRDVIARPLSSRLIAPSAWSENGFGVVGQNNISEQWQLDWEAYLVAGLGTDQGGFGLRSARQGFGLDNNNNKAVVAHATLRRGDALGLGLGVYNGAYDAAGERNLRGFGLDFIWYPAPWKLSGEYLHMRGERSVDTGTLKGGFVRVGYDLDTLLPSNWAGKFFPDAKFALVYEYDYVSIADLTSVLGLAQSESKHLLGFRYQPDKSWNLKVNREWSSASGPALVNGSGQTWLIGIGFVF